MNNKIDFYHDQYDPYWKALNQHQVEEAKQRQLQDFLHKQKVKQSYNQQLQKLIEERKRKKQDEAENERRYETELLTRSLQVQKRNLQMEQQKLLQLNKLSSKIDRDNQILHGVRKNRQQIKKVWEKEILNAQINTIEQQNRAQRTEEQLKKNNLRRELAENVQIKQLLKKKEKMGEIQLEKRLLQEQERITERMDAERVKFLNGLKQKAKIVDHHNVYDLYRKLHNKSEEEKKREEIITYNQMIQNQKLRKQYEDQERQKKQIYENRYRQQLKEQIIMKQYIKKKNKSIEETEKSYFAQKLSVDKQDEQTKRREEEQKKSEYLIYLQKQATINKKTRNHLYQMTPQEYDLNKKILEAGNTDMTNLLTDRPKGIIPGAYNIIDHETKIQQKYVENSIQGRPIGSENRTISYNEQNAVKLKDSYFLRNGQRVLN